MKVPSTDPCLDSISSLGQASKHSEADPYEKAQLADLEDLEKSERDADSWRRVASVEAIAVVGMVGLCLLLGSHSQHDVLVYREGVTGLSYQNEAIQTRTPSQLAVEAQLVSFVKAVRSVPGIAYALVDQNVELALQMTADSAPAHAHQDMIAYFTDPTDNPKTLGKNGEVRTVLDPVIASPVNPHSWVVIWGEEDRLQGQRPHRSMHQGTITIADPVIPTDPQVASIDPAGVEVIQYDLHL